MGGNARLIAFLQRTVGHTLTGLTSEQVLFLLYGTGANGKTTFLEALRALLGDYARQTDFSSFLTQKTDRIRNDIARLAGARFVSAVEVQEGRALAEVIVKQLTGGDSVTARFLFKEFFEFVPQGKIYLAANHKPVIKGTDLGIWRRIVLVPFTVTIPPERQDKKLLEKLKAELPGILAWSVRGCLAWQKHGLEVPQEVQYATESYRDEMDVLKDFLTECCFEHPTAWVTAKALYQAYREWCERNGLRPLDQRDFGLRLTERCFDRDRGTGNVHIRRGIGLVTQVTEESVLGNSSSDEATAPGSKFSN
jgi:putative DNA primase/helicase